jgi:hypothetical protein
VCVAGTRWVQTELLEKYPNANLRVYAVWFSMMPADARSKWSSTLLIDGRVSHRWDEGKVVGRWFARRTAAIKSQLAAGSAWSDGEILWDAYLLYGADARWDDEPSGLIHWGRTIVAGRGTLKEDFERLFEVKK